MDNSTTAQVVNEFEHYKKTYHDFVIKYQELIPDLEEANKQMVINETLYRCNHYQSSVC